MIFVELAFVVVVVWAFVHVTLSLMERTKRPTTAGTARWRIVHHDVEGVTRIALQKYDHRGEKVGGEHLVSTIPLDDPDYEAGFLAGMESARQRRALFETEEDR